jgi:integrase
VTWRKLDCLKPNLQKVEVHTRRKPSEIGASPAADVKLVQCNLRAGAIPSEGIEGDDLGVAIDLPKLPKRLPKPLEADELERVTAEPTLGVDEPQLRDRALVAFLPSTGCRISEALQMDRADWNAERVIVRNGDVERTAVITGRGAVICASRR